MYNYVHNMIIYTYMIINYVIKICAGSFATHNEEVYLVSWGPS